MKQYSSFLLFALLLLVAPSVVFAQDKDSSSSWSVDDILKQESLREVAIGPDGARVLWVKSSPDTEKDRATTDLYLTYLDDPYGSDEPSSIRLTRTGNNSDPAWSPDGQQIAFASTREEEDREGRQIWLLDPRGGAPRPLTKLENGVRSFAWLDDEKLLFSAREDKTHHEEQKEEDKDDARAVEDTTEFYAVRLFTVEAQSGDVERLTENEGTVETFAADPSGRYVAYSLRTSPITADARNQPDQYLLDLETGETMEIFDEQYLDPTGYEWTLDGEGFYASDSYSSDPENEGAGITELYYFDLTSREYEKVPLDWENGVGYGGYAVTPEGLHVQLADGPHMQARFYRREGDTWTHESVSDERFQHSTSIDIGLDGETIVFDYSRADQLPTYHVAQYQQGSLSNDQELAQINEYLKEKTVPKAEIVEWTGAEGDTVNGILYYPLDYEEGRRYPLVTVIHGGPSGVDLDAWRLSWTVYPGLLAQRGAFVFRPNYHGSGHHGLEFVESIKGRYYELEVPDIVSGIEHLVDRGMVDRDSLGVMGWSNGAILTIALTVEHPEMFKVAAPGAGDVNWISDYGNCAFGVRFDDSYFGGPPWERLDHYIEKSPLFQMDRVVTPTLIQFGEEDTAVPTEQGWQHYRAMQQIGNAPVRFILYPGEGHGLSRLSHQRRKVEEDLAWIDTYLFGETSMEERLAERRLPEDAPLRQLDRLQEIARTDGRYGEQVSGILAPETISLGDTLQVGRFEVTRAQWNAFRDGTTEPGEENHPATGISFEDAQAYVQWLSEETGRSYRLPTEKEAEAIRKLAGSSENSLRYWAGYAPTPDERKALEARLNGTDPDRLLMPVGSRPPGNTGEANAPLVFDADGNAAEWAVGEDGSGTAEGASAVTLEDDKASEDETPPPGFIGLRVVVE